jgi:putative colanic acid biosynthesis acetyltransferase WcaF
MKRNLNKYCLPNDYVTERSFFVRGIWHIVNNLILNSFIPGSWFRVKLLILFGANIGNNIVIKPYVRVKYPWKLIIRSDSWIGESVWIDNHTFVSIGESVCISQGAYLCCGSHDWNDPHFKLIVGPITIESGGWICAFAKLGPNTLIGTNSVVSMGESFSGILISNSIRKNMSTNNLNIS